MSTRLSVNINDSTALDLRTLAEAHGTTVTEEVRRAVSVYAFVCAETAAGKSLRVVEPDGSTTEVILL